MEAPDPLHHALEDDDHEHQRVVHRGRNECTSPAHTASDKYKLISDHCGAHTFRPSVRIAQVEANIDLEAVQLDDLGAQEHEDYGVERLKSGKIARLVSTEAIANLQCACAALVGITSALSSCRSPDALDLDAPQDQEEAHQLLLDEDVRVQ